MADLPEGPEVDAGDEPVTLDELRSRGATFICVRRSGPDPSPPSGLVWCPLAGRPEPCRWSGAAVDVGEHLAQAHGRRYERG